MNQQDKLIELNQNGLIHGPDESEKQYFIRCQAALSQTFHSYSSRALELFDIQPSWVNIIYDNKGLHLWEGGCTLIEQDRITLQLKESFCKKSSYFGYSREEVVAHELVHVVRGQFEEPIFEEILAYQSSASPFRRFFGPFFRSPKETWIVLGALFLTLLATLFSTFASVAYFGMIGLLFAGGIRLTYFQSVFSKTRRNLAALVGKQKVLAVMVRLTDREIIRFSKMSPEEIQAYAKKMRKIQLRWEQINGAYFELYSKSN